MNRISYAAVLMAACAASSIAFAQTATGTASGQAKPGTGQAPGGSGFTQQGQGQPAQGLAATSSAAVADQKLARLKPEERAKLEAQAKAVGVDLKALAAQDPASAKKALEAKKVENDIALRLADERKKLSTLDAQIGKMNKDDKSLAVTKESRERQKKVVVDLETKLAAAQKGKDAAPSTATQQKAVEDASKMTKEMMDQRNAMLDAIAKMMQQMNDTQNAMMKNVGK